MQSLAFILLQDASNPILGFLPLLLIIVIFYFLVFMPIQRQKKQTQQMLSSLQTGQTVVTSGGIIGQILSIADDSLVLRVKPDGIKLQVARTAVAGLVEEKK
jgi:preprotein translocase subunit YajC